jgi:hypothetical protein
MNQRDFPFKRNTAIEPVAIPAKDVASKIKVPMLPEGSTSFGVDNAFPIFIRLVGTGYGAAQFNAAAEGKGWIFGPGKHGPFSTQFPEFMSAIAVDRPGYPIKNADGTLRFPEATLEVFYGSGGGGWGGAGTPFVTVLNPATTVATGTSSDVRVTNFPATQPVSGTVSVSGSVAVTGTFWQATQPVSGTVAVSNFPTTQTVGGTVNVGNFPASQAVTGVFWQNTQPVSGTVAVSNFPASQTVSVSNFPATQPVSGTVSVGNFPASQTVSVSNFPATQPVSIAAAVNVNDNGGSLTTDTPQLPATLGAKASAASLPVVVASDQAPISVTDAGGSFTVDTGSPGVFALTPSSLAANSLVPIRNTGSSSLILKATPGNLYSAYSVAGNTGYILMALDRTTVPAAGSTIVTTEIISMAQVPANGYGSISPPDIPDRFVNGCVLIATTSLTTITAPQNLPFFMRGKVA